MSSLHLSYCLAKNLWRGLNGIRVKVLRLSPCRTKPFAPCRAVGVPRIRLTPDNAWPVAILRLIIGDSDDKRRIYRHRVGHGRAVHLK